MSGQAVSLGCAPWATVSHTQVSWFSGKTSQGPAAGAAALLREQKYPRGDVPLAFGLMMNTMSGITSALSTCGSGGGER